MQRPAVIHKNVLTQFEVLIALRLVSPQDRKAIEAWIEVHGTPEQHHTLMESLASLPVGVAWVRERKSQPFRKGARTRKTT